MSVLSTLAKTVFNLCDDEEYEKQHLTEFKQFEVQLDALLKEERIIRSAVFDTATSISKEEEYKQYIAQIMRILSSLSDILNETLGNREANETTHIVLLQKKTLLVVNRLTAFIQKRLPVTQKKVNNANQMYKLGASVSAIAVFTKALLYATEIDTKGQLSIILRFIIRHFSSIDTDEIAYKSFRNSYDKPDPRAVSQIITLLDKMIRFLKKL